jgi:beta-galactosidase
MWEYKHILQPLEVEALDMAEGRFRATNRRFFTDLGDLNGRFEILQDGAVVESGSLPVLTTAPRETEEFELDLAEVDAVPGAEYRLVLRWALGEDTAWAEAGHEVAFEEFPMDLREPIDPADLIVEDFYELQAQQGQEGFVCRNRDCRVVFDRATGVIETWKAHDLDLLQSGPVFNVWRAPTDNDGWYRASDDMRKFLGRWLKAGLKKTWSNVEDMAIVGPNPHVVR